VRNARKSRCVDCRCVDVLICQSPETRDSWEPSDPAGTGGSGLRNVAELGFRGFDLSHKKMSRSAKS
jgi:hypothetical protein